MTIRKLFEYGALELEPVLIFYPLIPVKVGCSHKFPFEVIFEIYSFREICFRSFCAHPKIVTTIEWSPSIVTTPNGSTVRVLLSTGNDCMVIFWSFNEKDKQFDSGQPIRFCERTKSSDKDRVQYNCSYFV